MQESIYSKLPKLKVEINLTSIVGSILVIIFAFVIPVNLIQNLQNSQQMQNVTGPQVAGISTSKEEQEPSRITIPIINSNVALEGQSGMLILIGLLLIGICIFIIMYLFLDAFIRKKK